MLAPTPISDNIELENQFFNMAFSELERAYPDLMSSIVTFKVIDADLENGSPLGVFVALVNGLTLYIPAIYNGSSLKPIDIVYVKELNSYLPLSKAWIDQLFTVGDTPIGAGMNSKYMANSVTMDPRRVPVNDVFIPPQTYRNPVVGRSSYASSDKIAEDRFLNFLNALPNEAKEEFRKTAFSSEIITSYLNDHYNLKDISDALKPIEVSLEKQALASKHKVVLIKKDEVNKETLKKLCSAVPSLAERLNTEGQAIMDFRPKNELRDRVTFSEDLKIFDRPNETGLYLIPFKTGEFKRAAVFTNVKKIGSESFPPNSGIHIPPESGATPWIRGEDAARSLLLIFEDGTCDTISTSKIMMRKVSYNKDDLIDFLTPFTTFNPAIGDYGFWMHQNGNIVEVTAKSTIDRIFTKDDTDKYFNNDGSIVSVTDGTQLSIIHPLPGSNIICAPADSAFIRIPPTDHANSSFFTGAGNYVSTFAEYDEFTKLSLDASEDFYTAEFRNPWFLLAGDPDSYSESPFIVKLAGDLNITLDDAREITERAKTNENCPFFIQKISQLEKIAQPAKPSKGTNLAGLDGPMLEKIIELGMKELFESTTAASLGANKELAELASTYMSTLTESLSSIAKVLLILRYKTEEYTKKLGREKAEELENALTTVLKELGTLVLLLKTNVAMTNQIESEKTLQTKKEI